MRSIGVIAFGHVNFKRYCEEHNLVPAQTVHCRTAEHVMACEELHVDATAPKALRELAIVKQIAAIEGVEVSLWGDGLMCRDPNGGHLQSFNPVSIRGQRKAIAAKYSLNQFKGGEAVCLEVIRLSKER